MAEPMGPPEPASSPVGREAASDPRGFEPRGLDRRATLEVLGEIQNEQGRHAERVKVLSEKMDAFGEKIEELRRTMSLVDRNITDFGPKIERHNNLYQRLLGASWIIAAVLLVSGTLLYWTNSRRLDKLIKVLDSPGIEKILKRDGK